MAYVNQVRSLAVSLLLTASAIAAPAFAQISFDIRMAPRYRR